MKNPQSGGTRRPTRAELEALQLELARHREASQTQAAEIRSRIQQLSQEAGERELELAKARQEASDLRRRLEEGASEAADRRLQEAADRIRSLEEEARQKTSLLGEREARIRSLEEDLVRAAESEKQAQEETGALRLERDKARLRASQFEVEQGRLQARIEEARAAQGGAEASLAALRGELEGARKDVQDRDAELKEVVRRLVEFEDERAALQHQADEARSALARAREAEAKARAEADQLKAETQRQEATRKSQEVRLDDLRRSLADLAGKIQTAAATPPPEPAPLPPAPGIDELFADLSEPPAVEVAPPPPAEPAADPGVLPAEVAAAASKAENLFGAPGENGEPPYVLLEPLYRDAMGGVYRAFDRPERRWVAVRFVAGQAEESQTAAIEQEIHRLIGLPHPHILSIAATGRRQDHLYVVTDLSKAETLGKTKIPEVSRISRIVRDCAEALHYAHEEGIFHGDVNPENILIESREGADHALVKDFGLGYLLETVALRAASNRPDLMIRNPAFLPPEQTQDAKRTIDVAGDVYALGATLYASLTGKPPFEGKDIRQVRSRVMMMEPPPLEKVRADVPPALAVIVRRAMAKERGIRYASAQELAEALTRFLEGAGTRVRVNPALKPTAPA